MLEQVVLQETPDNIAKGFFFFFYHPEGHRRFKQEKGDCNIFQRQTA